MAGRSVTVALGGKGTYKFREIIEGISKEMPEVRQAVLEDVGAMISEEMDKAIDKSNLNPSAKSTVRNWQQLYYGEKAYVAMRPSTVAYGAHKYNGEPVTQKQITRWLEHGHGTRPASETMEQKLSRTLNGRKAVRTGKGFVAAKPFYWYAQSNTKNRVKAVAEAALAREMKRRV